MYASDFDITGNYLQAGRGGGRGGSLLRQLNYVTEQITRRLSSLRQCLQHLSQRQQFDVSSPRNRVMSIWDRLFRYIWRSSYSKSWLKGTDLFFFFFSFRYSGVDCTSLWYALCAPACVCGKSAIFVDCSANTSQLINAIRILVSSGQTQYSLLHWGSSGTYFQSCSWTNTASVICARHAGTVTTVSN